MEHMRHVPAYYISIDGVAKQPANRKKRFQKLGHFKEKVHKMSSFYAIVINVI